jgi:hypothetical protein
VSGHRIVVATADTIGARMAGPAIRAWQIASALAAEHDVRLVTTAAAHPPANARFEVQPVDDSGLIAAAAWSEIFVFQGWALAGRPAIPASDVVMVADAYDPMHLEQLEQGRHDGAEGWRRAVAGATDVLNEQLLRADFVLCASERQRELWLGHLASLGRVNPCTYEEDPSLRRLIDVVPFGVADDPPSRSGPGPKGTIPGIDPGDELVLWGGGIYNWFDPETLIRAVDRLRSRRPRVRLLFMGMQHPNPEIPMMRAAVDAVRLAEELGIAGSHVFFNEGWVPYEERTSFLLDADVGVSTHLDHLETAFSFRTRVLDYLWASLPVLSTDGDAMSELIEAHRAGVVVPAGDVDAVVAGLDRLLGDHRFRAVARAGSAELAENLRWSRVLAPLVTFCGAPRRAPDLVHPDLGPTLVERRHAISMQHAGGWRRQLRIARIHLTEGGVLQLVRRAAGRVVRLARSVRPATTRRADV